MTAVVFDLDDTLVDTTSAFALGIEAAMAVLAPGLDAETNARALARWRQDPGGHYRAHTRGRLGYAEQRAARVRDIAAHLGLGVPDARALAAWNATFDEAFEAGWRAFDDAADCLEALAAAGCAVGLVTNAHEEVQRRKLAATGLEHVPLLVTLDTFGVGKPDPRVFREACRLLGAEPSRTAYIGDELDTDARGARDAGLRGMWLARPGRRRGGDHDEDPIGAVASGVRVLTTLADLPRELAALG